MDEVPDELNKLEEEAELPKEAIKAISACITHAGNESRMSCVELLIKVLFKAEKDAEHLATIEPIRFKAEASKNPGTIPQPLATLKNSSIIHDPIQFSPQPGTASHIKTIDASTQKPRTEVKRERSVTDSEWHMLEVDLGEKAAADANKKNDKPALDTQTWEIPE